MNPDSAPGPDGFTQVFYMSCWNIIGADVMQAIRGFFNGLPLPGIISATHLTLIPKVPNASSISKLRPISLCNVIHKIISHIVMRRLAPIIPGIICEEQAGFVRGRSMHGHIALAHDIIHDLDHDVRGTNAVIKLDLAKAYDRLSWGFLFRIMKKYGFSEKWCDLIFRCISNCFYSVKWDGNTYGFFRSSRGVRQGDPLSPSLFIMAMDWLSRSMNKATGDGLIQHYSSLQRALKINHLLFADDILLFSSIASPSLQHLMDLLNRFCSLSGEDLNPSKSVIIFSNRADDSLKSAAYETRYVTFNLYQNLPKTELIQNE